MTRDIEELYNDDKIDDSCSENDIVINEAIEILPLMCECANIINWLSHVNNDIKLRILNCKVKLMSSGCQDKSQTQVTSESQSSETDWMLKERNGPDAERKIQYKCLRKRKTMKMKMMMGSYYMPEKKKRIMTTLQQKRCNKAWSSYERWWIYGRIVWDKHYESDWRWYGINLWIFGSINPSKEILHMS